MRCWLCSLQSWGEPVHWLTTGVVEDQSRSPAGTAFTAAVKMEIGPVMTGSAGGWAAGGRRQIAVDEGWGLSWDGHWPVGQRSRMAA